MGEVFVDDGDVEIIERDAGFGEFFDDAESADAGAENLASYSCAWFRYLSLPKQIPAREQFAIDGGHQPADRLCIAHRRLLARRQFSPWLRTAKLINCQSMGTAVLSATAASQRVVFHENGHTGTNQIVTSQRVGHSRGCESCAFASSGLGSGQAQEQFLQLID